MGGLLGQFHSEFEKKYGLMLFHLPIDGSNYIKSFMKRFKKVTRNDRLAAPLTPEMFPQTASALVSPNKMQENALQNLKELRSTGAVKRTYYFSYWDRKKTYLSAFDVKNFAPSRMLFVVHREQILHKALADYQRILGGTDSDFWYFIWKQ
ncbi:DEAD/DEAH box helicase family protein [Paenibacillus rhizoplanae]